MTCDDYQIAFDQLAGGAACAVPADEVDAHIATCADCTAYASLSRKVSTSMMNTLTASRAPLDIAAMRARVTSFHQHANRDLVIWPVVFGGSFLLMSRLVFDPSRSWTGAIVGAAVATVLAALLLAFRLRSYTAGLTALAAKPDDELVVGLRAELDRRIRNERQGWWVLPMVLAAFHWRLVGWALPSGPLVVFELCYLALFPLGIVRYRRAKRERALLA